MPRQKLRPRKLLVASRGVMTVSYLMAGCDPPPERGFTIANLMAAPSVTQPGATATGTARPAVTVGNLPSTPVAPMTGKPIPLPPVDTFPETGSGVLDAGNETADAASGKADAASPPLDAASGGSDAASGGSDANPQLDAASPQLDAGEKGSDDSGSVRP